MKTKPKGHKQYTRTVRGKTQSIKQKGTVNENEANKRAYNLQAIQYLTGKERHTYDPKVNEAINKKLIEIYASFKRQPKGKGKLVKLTAQEVVAMIKVGEFAAISAGTNPIETKKGIKNNSDIIKKREKKLIKKLKEKGFQYTIGKGKYGTEETSIQVVVHDAKDRQELLDLGKELKQESVLFSKQGKVQIAYCDLPFNKGKVGKSVKGEGFTFKESVTDKDDYYTAIPMKDGSTFVFTANITGSWDKPTKLVMKALEILNSI